MRDCWLCSSLKVWKKLLCQECPIFLFLLVFSWWRHQPADIGPDWSQSAEVLLGFKLQLQLLENRGDKCHQQWEIGGRLSVGVSCVTLLKTSLFRGSICFVAFFVFCWNATTFTLNIYLLLQSVLFAVLYLFQGLYVECGNVHWPAGRGQSCKDFDYILWEISDYRSGTYSLHHAFVSLCMLNWSWAVYLWL